ncbi:MAG: hypothetical protein ACPLZF_04940 [Nitrososphaeria archaeon]
MWLKKGLIIDVRRIFDQILIEDARFDLRFVGFFILLAYVLVRVIWEIGTVEVTMPPYYCVLNIFALTPFFLMLLYSFYAGKVGGRLLFFMLTFSFFYLFAYLLLGLTFYPLLLTPRLQPKFLFIDLFTLLVTCSTIFYILWLLIKIG